MSTTVPAAELASKLNVDQKWLEQTAKEKRWERERKKFLKKQRAEIAEKEHENVGNLYAVSTVKHTMEIEAYKKELEWYEAYFKLHGDFFKRDIETGEIIKDISGLPISIRLPRPPTKHLEASKLINAALDYHEQKSETTIDVTPPKKEDPSEQEAKLLSDLFAPGTPNED
jgi:hypothetical protein